MQTDIFSTSEKPDPEAHQAYKNLPQKRIHNTKPTYTKTYENYQDTEGNVFDDTATWGRMDTVYKLLANHFPLLFTQENIQQIGVVRTIKIDYHAEKYKYKDLMNPRSQWKIYTGQEFTVRQAEIVGSENLGIEERLFLHETLLEYLEEGYKIEQLNWWIESLLNLYLQHFSAKTIILMLILWKKE